ncbi:thymidylate kinase [Catenuloplanes nepalensis]|uniref:Thymidylate kinase n=1 Tax=Catenuloplanes nepalensis TaxID=587533 RepID=A0ABT9MRW5_9ACTN|nr:deoxynucleoside kinase [Catenuloplanes nepalensis]MDP9794172.1 thymidylate kinase [Catenuloplanes nepalensis]
MSNRRDQPLWISVDGVDGVGKTTLASALAGELHADLSSEFSDGFLGAALREAVTRAPNYVTVSRTAQSLAFIGDFFEVYATQVSTSLRAGRTVVSDRGWLSKYAYQLVTLTEEHGEERARTLLDASLGLMPRPHLTLYLTASEDNIRQRLTRRDGSCEDDRMQFVRTTSRAAETAITNTPLALRHVRLDANPAASLVLDQAVSTCRAWFG